MIKSYLDLIVWQKAIDLALEIYKLVKQLPKDELYVLSDQMRRAAVSIPSNIAEGQGRSTRKEFIYFLHIARGSKCELQTQLILCERLTYLTKDQVLDACNLLDEIGKMLNALINSLTTNH